MNWLRALVMPVMFVALAAVASGCAGAAKSVVGQDLISEVDRADDDVLKAMVYDSDLPVAVLFTASPCITCQPVEDVIDAVGPDFDGWVRFLKINANNSAPAVKSLKVGAIPTLVIFDGRKEVERMVGGIDKKELGAILNRVLDIDDTK